MRVTKNCSVAGRVGLRSLEVGSVAHAQICKQKTVCKTPCCSVQHVKGMESGVQTTFRREVGNTTCVDRAVSEAAFQRGGGASNDGRSRRVLGVQCVSCRAIALTRVSSVGVSGTPTVHRLHI
jgi:hypothetical protein